MDGDGASPLLVVVKGAPLRKKQFARQQYLKKVNRVSKPAKTVNRQSYRPEDVLAAMHAIWQGMSRRQAAKAFNIPRSTLLDKLDGKRPVEASPGPSPFLTKAEEHNLEAWSVDMYRRGFPLKTEDLKDMAQEVIQTNQRKTSFKNGRPGRSWMRNFLLRHPRMHEMGPSPDFQGGAGAGPGPAGRARRLATRDEVLRWCQQHRNFMSALGHEDILDDPLRVFNVDHAEFVFDAATGQYLENEKLERTEEPADRAADPLQLPLPTETERTDSVDCVSVVAAFSAAGHVAPFMFVYPKELGLDNLEGFPPNWVATHSEGGQGLLTGKTFLDYIVVFRRWLERKGVRLPVLLLLDGRRSRLNMDVSRYCEEQGVILYCLFPTPRPAVAELFSALFKDSTEDIHKFNLPVRFHEALSALDGPSDGKSILHTYGILPHLETMLKTLGEVRAESAGSVELVGPVEPEGDLPPVPCFKETRDTQNRRVRVQNVPVNEEVDVSDCEFDSDLRPVEGEIEMEFPVSENWDPRTLAALHPALLSDSQTPSYLVMNAPLPIGPIVNSKSKLSVLQPITVPFNDCVELPDLSAHLVVEPLSSPLPETEEGIEKVDCEINKVLDSIISMEAMTRPPATAKVELEQLSPPPSPSEEPFLGFSPEDAPVRQDALNARGCVRFIEKVLSDEGLLQVFLNAGEKRQWDGDPEAKRLFDVWLAAKEYSA